MVVGLTVVSAAVVRRELAVVSMVVDGTRRGRGDARVDSTGNLPAPPTVADAAVAVGAVVVVVAAVSLSLLLFSALPPW